MIEVGTAAASILLGLFIGYVIIFVFMCLHSWLQGLNITMKYFSFTPFIFYMLLLALLVTCSFEIIE